MTLAVLVIMKFSVQFCSSYHASLIHIEVNMAAVREKIRLVSEAGTGYFYTTTKNKKSTPDKLRFKKYDPKVKQHVWFKEAKIK